VTDLQAKFRQKDRLTDRERGDRREEERLTHPVEENQRGRETDSQGDREEGRETHSPG
jgi:hypothetical protein